MLSESQNSATTTVSEMIWMKRIYSGWDSGSRVDVVLCYVQFVEIWTDGLWYVFMVIFMHFMLMDFDFWWFGYILLWFIHSEWSDYVNDYVCIMLHPLDWYAMSLCGLDVCSGIYRVKVSRLVFTIDGNVSESEWMTLYILNVFPRYECPDNGILYGAYTYGTVI